jgi:DNA-binding NarL/FixJ family response regulator
MRRFAPEILPRLPDCGFQDAPVRVHHGSMSITVLTVDDHALLREGIAAVIEHEADMTVVGEAMSGREAIERFRNLQPDVTLMDLRMEDMNGLQAICAIRKEFPAARIIVLTTYSGDMQAVGALEAGAAGYLLKSSLHCELLDAIRAVHSGKRRIPPDVALEIAAHAGEEPLSPREMEVLRQVAMGQANKVIATALRISEHTVSAHTKSILHKLNARDRTHAVMLALKRGILDL